LDISPKYFKNQVLEEAEQHMEFEEPTRVRKCCVILQIITQALNRELANNRIIPRAFLQDENSKLSLRFDERSVYRFTVNGQ
jgi:hypothetical protein